MRLATFHPQLMKFTCDDCKRIVYDMETGEPRTMGHTGRPIERPAVVPTPCDECPKVGPQHERDYVLTPANRKVVGLYHEAQATAGASLTPRMRCDRWLMEMLGRVGQVVTAGKNYELMKFIAKVNQ